MKKYIYLSLLSFISVGFYSCKEFKNSINDTLNEKVDSVENEKTTPVSTHVEKEDELVLVNNLHALEKAEKALRNRNEFKGKDIFIYRTIHFYDDGRINVKLQNPDNPLFIDQYQYKDEKWEEPTPVRLSKNDKIKEDLVNLNRVSFLHVNNVYNALVEKRKEIGSKSTDYTIYVAYYKDRVNWYPSTLSNDRYEYNIEFNEDGTLKSFEMK
ncbi:hypothetical protein [Chishuiella changwenlii]|uniref:hypothetical protein n=1 Tax=Chishuiella changwenlii TaxID=1434701 RepID=UPI002FD96C54